MSSATMNDPICKTWGLPVSLPPVASLLERLPLAVLILSIAFLQGYSLRFWSNLLDAPGWGISIGLEVIHLWAWYRAAVSTAMSRFAWMILAVAATGLLLAGALHEVTRPLLQESARIVAADQERQSLEAEARILTANLAAFRDMAADQGRRGWQEDIRRDTARLQAITDQLRILAARSGNSARQPWMIRVTQGGVIGVAVLFQIAAVLAIWSLSGGSRNAERLFPSQKSVLRNAGNVSETVETLRGQVKSPEQGFYKQIWNRIEAHARSNSARLARGNGNISQAALARDLGVNPPDISGIKLLAHGQKVPRNPARETVQRLAERFGITIPK